MDWMMACAGGERAFERRERHTKIRFGERFVHYPFENGLGDLPPQVNFECLKGYVAAWHRRTAGATPAPASFGAWVRWRFGAGIAEHFMDPYNQKVWKRDLDFLSSDWVAGRVPDAPVDDVLRASIGIRTEGYTHQASFYYPARGGFQAITDGIAAAVLGRVRLSTPAGSLVSSKGSSNGSWRVDGEAFDLVVSTLPLTYLPDLCREMPADVAAAMRTLEYNALTSVLVALDRPAHPDLSWVYLPHPEQGPANRITYMSNYAASNAPAGKSSLLCEVTHPGRSPDPGPELEREIQDGLVHAGLIQRGEVLFTDRASVEHAYVVFDHDYAARRAAALGWMTSVGLVPLGRFGRFEYDNSDQCVIKSRALAAELLAQAVAG